MIRNVKFPLELVIELFEEIIKRIVKENDVSEEEISKLKLYLISKYHIGAESDNTIKKSHKTKKLLYFIKATLKLIKKVYRNECFRISRYFCVNNEINEYFNNYEFIENLKVQSFKHFLKSSAGSYMLFNDIQNLREIVHEKSN